MMEFSSFNIDQVKSNLIQPIQINVESADIKESIPSSTLTADILDEIVSKTPTVASNIERLDAAMDYIGRVSAAVASVREAVKLAKATLSSDDMLQLRERYAHAHLCSGNEVDKGCVIDVTNVITTYTESRVINTKKFNDDDFDKFKKMRTKDFEDTLRQKQNVKEQKEVTHIGDAVDSCALFLACEKELDAALCRVETLFKKQVIDTVTREVRQAKTGVLFSMFSEHSMAGMEHIM